MAVPEVSQSFGDFTDLQEGSICCFGLWDWNRKTNLLRGDENVAKLFDLCPITARHGFHPDVFLNRIVRDDKIAIESNIANSLRRTGTFNARFRIVKSDGTLQPIIVQCKYVENALNVPDTIIGMIADIDIFPGILDKNNGFHESENLSEDIVYLCSIAKNIAKSGEFSFVNYLLEMVLLELKSKDVVDVIVRH